MGLVVEFGCVTGEGDDPRWYVSVDHIPKGMPRAVVWGYARKLDAQIAEKVLNGLMDWNQPEVEMRRQWNALAPTYLTHQTI